MAPITALRCKSCGEFMELPPQEPKVEVRTEPCRCGLTEFSRGVRWGALVLMTLFLCLFASCLAEQYFTTEQIRALPQNYEVIRNRAKGVDPKDAMAPGYKVVPREESDKHDSGKR